MNPSKEFYAENPSWNIISKLFNLSKKEFVFDDFSCSLWNKILLPGHLYCMENHICFYSDMMGTESKAIIKMEDIEEIKKSSFGFIKSGIEIVCKNKKSYYFTGFSDRDGVYNLIYGIVKGATPSIKEKATEEVRQNTGDVHKMVNANDTPDNQITVERDDGEIKEIVVLPVSKNSNPLETMKVILPISVDKFFESFISDEAVFSSADRLALQEAMNINVSPWKLNEETGLYTREIRFEAKVKDIPFATKTTRIEGDQTYKKTEDKLEIARTSRSLDVPFSTCFHLEERWHVSSVENSTTRCLLLMTAEVIMDKWCTFEKMIKSKSLKEMQADHNLWFRTVKERKLIEETPLSNGRGNVKTELKHEIERSEDLKLTRENLNGKHGTRKDSLGRLKAEDQLYSMKKGLKLMAFLLFLTIILFMLALLTMNRKLVQMQDRINYLEPLCFAEQQKIQIQYLQQQSKEGVLQEQLNLQKKLLNILT